MTVAYGATGPSRLKRQKSSMLFHSRMLRYLDEVARTGSMRQAARRLNVAASSVNRQILLLEESIGTPLFERLRGRLRLTTPGELLIAHVRDTLKDHARVMARIEDLKGMRRGQVNVGTMAGVAASIMLPVLTAIRQRHPLVTVNLRIMRINEIFAALEAGDIELGFAVSLPDDPTIHVEARAELRLGAVMASGHPLADKPSATLADCASYPLIVGSEGFSTRILLDDAFARLAIAVTPAFATESVDLMKRLATCNLGVTFLVAAAIEEERRRGELVFVPLRDRALKPDILKLVRRRATTLDYLPSLMLEMLKEAVVALGGRPG
jgi:DNA-binding transcriptional LysR family regulator